MFLRTLGIFVALLMVQAIRAQVPSPEKFLGYPIGTRFTPHWKIMDYFRAVAAAAPSTVKLEKYGETYEGRPLVVAYVSNATHISNLENIRRNNLKLAAAQSNDRGNTSAPALVWLSYNVHGNEASSSEASMLTLYALADPLNARTKGWLQNTVVIIDPCLNPDGRDRYVNWYHSVVGKNYDANIEAREHQEPWPGGRSNHYNFDLNRDWAWQTQLESQQRVKLYQNWLPQIHVDFHEQYPNSPYYFAPAAEPYHEVITPWQRDFQNTIGRNHARYFDEQGWLYFTKQYFDLLYPSYGDTYPIYNGSIGMTYEQAGHGMAGLGIQMERGGDTLTLTDRATHHFTTSLSTIEVAATQATRLLQEFQKYFTEAATTGTGVYKTYIIRQNTRDAERINSLLDLLRKNKIRFGTARSLSAKGYNYETGRDETFTLSANDIIVPAVQANGSLVKVLFEPRSVLADSLTYDITAWSLPYAYGLKAFATTQRIDISGEVPEPARPAAVADAYAYVIRWDGLKAVKLVGQLLQKGIRLRYSEEPFASGGQNFDRGSVIILRTSNQYVPELWATVRRLAGELQVPLYPVNSGFVDKGYDFGSNKIQSMKARRVALLTGDGVSSTSAGEVWHFFEQVIQYPLTLVNAADAANMNWNNFDVVIMPNGNYHFLNEKSSSEALKTWVSGGGKLIALERAVAQLSKLDWAIKAKKADEEDKDKEKDIYAALKRYENREREFIPNETPGSIFRVELDNTHPLAYGYPGHYYTLKLDDQIYEFIKEGGWNVGVIKKERQVSGFVGSRLQARLQDGLLFGVQDLGRGTITYLADNVLFRSFWENGKLLFSNAVFLVGQ
jgi:hypothetical protein